MIQCEDCFVWQHADCMNVTEETLPELYYCENCKPNGRKLDNFYIFEFANLYIAIYDSLYPRSWLLLSQLQFQTN